MPASLYPTKRSVSLEVNKAEEKKGNEEKKDAAATAIAMAAKLPSAAHASLLASPVALTQRVMRSNIS